MNPKHYQTLKSQLFSPVYKSLVIACTLMLLANLVLPAISATINYTRYFHFMLIILAPAFVMTFPKRTFLMASVSVLVIFLITSGFVFNILKIDSISMAGLPYSIALENRRLDAGNYLTDNDSEVARWAKVSGYPAVHGDIGGALIAQDYFGVYAGLPLQPLYRSGDLILVREWNSLVGWSQWAGPGLRRTMPVELPPGRIIYRVGQAYLWEVQ